MAQSNCRIFLVSLTLLLMTSSCEPTNTKSADHVAIADAPHDHAKETAAKKPAQIIADTQTEKTSLSPVAGAPVPAPDQLLTPPPFWGAPSSGGGGRRLRHEGGQLPCENHTTDCNDQNPCTVDSCNVDDQCEHTLDLSKSEFASCEVDGNSCTVGKCVLVNEEVLCHEVARGFLEGEIGCSDDNDCTADSCITETIGEKNQPTRFDAEGNVILDNDYQCVREVLNGIACFIENECMIGSCTSSGAGDFGDAFAVACVVNENDDNQPEAFCPAPPDAKGNPCQLAVCTVGMGCQVIDVADGTACNDGMGCTENDVCTNGVCSGAAIDCNDDVACTYDICDGTGACINIPDNGRCPGTGGDQCQVNVCDATEGCLLSDAAAGTICTDGDPCTIEDSCDDEGACSPGASLSCADSDVNDCQIPTCVSGEGCAFINAEPGIACADSDPCMFGDTCDGEGACSPGLIALVCPDYDESDCQIPSCVSGEGCELANATEGAACVDDDPCTLNDVCNDAGACEAGETIVVCADDDINDCQLPICRTGFGCDFDAAAEGALCQADASVCTMDMCNALGACITGTPIVCESDGNECTAEICDDKFGCIYPAGNDDSACDDDNACTTDTTCSNGACTGGSDTNCDDNNSCTVDHCGVYGGCFYTNLNGPQGDGCEVDGTFGTCAQGVTLCENGVASTDTCVQLFFPNPLGEICLNEIDDDCNGETDEGGCICPEVPEGDLIRYVATTGSDGDGNTCLNPLSPCLTIQYAHSVANTGDGISIAAGTYVITDTIDITKATYILGAGLNQTIIDGANVNGTPNEFGFAVADDVPFKLCGVTVYRTRNGLANRGITRVANSSFTDGLTGVSNGLIDSTVGDIIFTNCIMANNTALGVRNEETASLVNCLVDNNSNFNLGGGIFNGGTITVTNCTVSNNTLTAASPVTNRVGAGLMNFGGTVVINNSTFNNNTAPGSGGGIYNNFGTLTITNSTLSGNTADFEGGGIRNFNLGVVTMSNCTVTGNSAGIVNAGDNIHNSATFNISHTIVANAPDRDCNTGVSLTDLGNNLDEDNTCNFPSAPVDPNLGPLTFNGGPTQTHALIFPSAAIDGGGTSCGVTTDQRHLPRPVDYNSDDVSPLCDIGAFELQN